MVFLTSCQDNWQKTYAPDSEEPYGAALIYDNLKDLFPEKKITSDRKSIYNHEIHANISSIDLKDFSIENPLFDSEYSIETEVETPHENWVLIEPIAFTEEDIFSIFNHCIEGNHVLVSSEHFDRYLADGLQISSTDSIIMDTTVTLDVEKNAYSFDQVYKIYTYKSPLLQEVLIRFNEQIVASKINIGKGSLTICSTPTLFTNYNFIKENNHELIELLLAPFSPQTLRWHQHYNFREFERAHTTLPPASYLDYIYDNPELAAAYFVLLLGGLLYAIFGIKRTQRMIPKMKKPENSTVKFITQIGQLYQDNGSHIELAHKKTLFFNEWLKHHYHIKSSDQIIDTLEIVEAKNSNIVELSAALKDKINIMYQVPKISKKELFELNKIIEKIKSRA